MVRGDPVRGNPRPPQYLSRHAKLTASKLSEEAKETSAAVRKILQYEGIYLPTCIQFCSLLHFRDVVAVQKVYTNFTITNTIMYSIISC